MSYDSDKFAIDDDDLSNVSKEVLENMLEEYQYDANNDEFEDNSDDDQFDFLPVVDANAPVTGSYRNSVLLTNMKHLIQQSETITDQEQEEEKKYFKL